MTRTAILTAIRNDGFDLPSSPSARDVAANIQQAARAGRLVWNSERIVSTLEDHLVDLRRAHPPRRG